MAAKLLDGKTIAAGIKTSISREIEATRAKAGRSPKLAAIQAGQSAPSVLYVNTQRKAAESLGIKYELKVVPDTISQKQAEEIVNELNADAGVDAFMLHLPVPKGIDAKKLAGLIKPEKDAEGIHPQNLGRILLGDYRIGPCTALAVMELLESTGEKLYGKEAVLVGHSEIVGKPLSLMLLNKFATTTVCHIATGQRGILPEHVKRAEVLVVAIGRPGIIKGEWIKPGAIVIDVGINRVADKIIGDVEFSEAASRASYITPVPGGVGPLTTIMLMRNTIELYKSYFENMRIKDGA